MLTNLKIRLFFDFLFLDSVEMGIALQNFLTRAMKFSKTGNESLLPLSFYAGSRFNMFNDRISLFNSINARGFNVGTEIEIEKLLIQRSEIDNKIDLLRKNKITHEQQNKFLL